MIEYPYQVLHTQKSICYDNAIYGAYILSRLGYNTSVISFAIPTQNISHAFTGVATIGIPTYKGSGYSGIDRGFVPTDVGQANNAPIWSVVQVSPGNTLDLTREYNDATQFNTLTPTANTSKEDLGKWNNLVAEYGL
jgi:hypothetical protein